MNHASTFSSRVLFAACVLSAAGALVFNAFPLFLSAISNQFQLNDEQLGLLGTTYLGGFAVVAATSIWWICRLSPRTLAIVSYVAIVCSVVALSLATSSGMLYAAMATLGAGAGVIFTLGLEILAHSRDPDRAFGFKLCAEMLLAGLLMYGMTTFVISQFGYQGFVIGVLVVYGLTTLSVIVLPVDVLSITLQETASVKGVGNIACGYAAIALFIQFGAFSALWGFMERIGVDMGVTEDAVGNILSLSVMAGLGGAMFGAALGNRFGQIKPLLIAFGLTAFSVLCLYFSGGTTLFLVVACAINALLQICVIYQMGLVTSIDRTGKLTVLIAFILATGGAVGPGVAGMIVERSSFDDLYLLVCCVCGVSAVLTLLAGLNYKQEYHVIED